MNYIYLLQGEMIRTRNNTPQERSNLQRRKQTNNRQTKRWTDRIIEINLSAIIGVIRFKNFVKNFEYDIQE